MGGGVQIRKEQKGESLIFHLEGKLDAVSSPVLEDSIAHEIEQGQNHILLDFAQIDYLSSAGLRVLLSNTKKLKTRGGGLVVYGMMDDVLEIVKMAGFEKVLSLSTTETEALNQGQ